MQLLQVIVAPGRPETSTYAPSAAVLSALAPSLRGVSRRTGCGTVVAGMS